jgi:hypothetical protein
MQAWPRWHFSEKKTVIRSQDALLRHAQEFFLAHMVGLYHWDQVQVAAPERAQPIPSNIGGRERRKLMEAREGRGRFLEQARLVFPLPVPAAEWEILIYSSVERPPIGEVVLRDANRGGQVLVEGPLDPSTWTKIGNLIKERASHQRKHHEQHFG